MTHLEWILFWNLYTMNPFIRSASWEINSIVPGTPIMPIAGSEKHFKIETYYFDSRAYRLSGSWMMFITSVYFTVGASENHTFFSIFSLETLELQLTHQKPVVSSAPLRTFYSWWNMTDISTAEYSDDKFHDRLAGTSCKQEWSTLRVLS